MFAFLVLGMIMLFSTKAFAFPIISFDPSQDVLVREPLTIKVSCIDNESGNSNVSAEIMNEIKINKTLDYNPQSQLYTTTIESLYFPDNFNVTVFCIDNMGNQTFNSTNFTVSNFTTSIVGISALSTNPNTIYTTDPIEIDVLVKKNGTLVTSGASFAVTLGGNQVTPEITPKYYTSKGWVIYLKPQSVSKTYDLRIDTSYGRFTDSQTASLIINNPIQFDITNIDKTWVKFNDTINLQIKALEYGALIPLTTSNLAIQVDSAQATITSITLASNYYNVAVLMPSLSSGSRILMADDDKISNIHL
jgi:hypothetical protein